jgi:ssDNA-binding Zn-finger/Zn-ribbon topoisomerase 1
MMQTEKGSMKRIAFDINQMGVFLWRRFSSYGGTNHINLGICKECQKNNPEAKIIRIPEPVKAAGIEVNKCPNCGGDLEEKTGKFGRFISCSNYPNCRYTRSIQ